MLGLWSLDAEWVDALFVVLAMQTSYLSRTMISSHVDSHPTVQMGRNPECVPAFVFPSCRCGAVASSTEHSYEEPDPVPGDPQPWRAGRTCESSPCRHSNYVAIVMMKPIHFTSFPITVT